MQRLAVVRGYGDAGTARLYAAQYFAFSNALPSPLGLV